MKIGICNDHAGVNYKNRLVEYLTAKGYEMVNFGTDTTDSMDYPDVAHPLASAVENREVDLGIAFCGTGNGMQMALNKHQGIRAGLCWSVEIGKLIKHYFTESVHSDTEFCCGSALCACRVYPQAPYTFHSASVDR